MLFVLNSDWIKDADTWKSVGGVTPSASYALHWWRAPRRPDAILGAPVHCKLHAVPACVTASSPDTDTQPSTLVLCPQYLVLGAWVPQCLGIDAQGTLGSSVLRCPQCTKASTPGASTPSVFKRFLTSVASYLGASASLVTRELHASVLRRLLSPVQRCLRCLEDYMSQCFDALRYFMYLQYPQGPQVPGAP
ncbi:UNVERIFIED_CONTAM: hypothetical protein FKN15_049125 [Acipenser sinensis]